ncbi:hypothetical protein CO008_02645 [Candidatus Roizmanbacteria bacterium CG_4_8_14_3_um_filter_36_12]|nr:MAG: hypothetical protein CO008_02645 [Candidatus Roizmanbacteria bacterium CG_4_8_14_3_um_filter_36_12]
MIIIKKYINGIKTKPVKSPEKCLHRIVRPIANMFAALHNVLKRRQQRTELALYILQQQILNKQWEE